ncbi:MAG: hypothetical protein CML03_08845 [Pseudooceanicola sp.]|nr:hypothetical protein [Pseudooceanicola sp.]
MIYAANGASIHICTTPQATEPVNAAAYEALTFVKVGELETLGSFGDTAEEIVFRGLEYNRVQRLKGTRDAGTLETVFGRDYADAGQVALIAAEADDGADGDYAIKIAFNDAPSGGTPSERYFLAAVASATEQLDQTNQVIKLASTLWINTKITRVNAASGV